VGRRACGWRAVGGAPRKRYDARANAGRRRRSLLRVRDAVVPGPSWGRTCRARNGASSVGAGRRRSTTIPRPQHAPIDRAPHHRHVAPVSVLLEARRTRSSTSVHPSARCGTRRPRRLAALPVTDAPSNSTRHPLISHPTDPARSRRPSPRPPRLPRRGDRAALKAVIFRPPALCALASPTLPQLAMQLRSRSSSRLQRTTPPTDRPATRSLDRYQRYTQRPTADLSFLSSIRRASARPTGLARLSKQSPRRRRGDRVGMSLRQPRHPAQGPGRVYPTPPNLVDVRRAPPRTTPTNAWVRATSATSAPAGSSMTR